MAVRWWVCEGVQIPASASSEHGPPSERVRHCYTPDAADGAVDPVFLKPNWRGQCVANLVGMAWSCAL
jgi:hypothetical protein